MKNGICPKCNSTNITRFGPRNFAGDRAAWDYESVTLFKVAYTSRYVCLDCGYSERYFEDEELQKIIKKAEKDRGEA